MTAGFAMCMRGRRATQRGAALLLAMLVVALVASLAASVTWQQWRSVQAERDERAQMQVRWLVRGAMDWSKIILRSDAQDDGKQGNARNDHFNEPWSVPVAESKLSTFLAAEGGVAQNANADIGEAFFAGGIEDLNGRLNLANLIVDGRIDNEVQQQFERLFVALGLPAEAVAQLAQQYLDATRDDLQARVGLAPSCVEQLGWLGLAPQQIAQLRPHVTVLPASNTPINLNTASELVLAAALPEGSENAARSIVARAASQPFDSLQQAQQLMPEDGPQLNASRFGVSSQFFLARGQLRIDELDKLERYILRRDGLQLRTIGRACAVPYEAE